MGKKVLVFGAGRSRIFLPSGQEMDLRGDSEWRRFVDSISAHVPATRPSFYGPGHLRRRMGAVVEVVGAVSRDVLIEAGVSEHTVPHPEYVLLRVELTERGERYWSDGEIEHTSISIALDYVDEAGEEHPYFLSEVAFVPEPHVRTQPPASQLEALRLSARRSETVCLDGGTYPTQEAQMAMEKLREALQSALDALTEIEGGAAADDAAENLADGEHDEREPERAEDYEDKDRASDPEDEHERMASRAVVQRLEAQIARERSEREALQSQIAKERSERERAEKSATIERTIERMGLDVTEDTRADLVDIGVADPKRFERLAATLPRRGDGVRRALSTSSEQTSRARTPHERLSAAQAYAREHKTDYETALRAVGPLTRGGVR